MSTDQIPDPYLLLTFLDPGDDSAYPQPLPFAAPWQYELHFPRDPRGPGVARVTLRAVLRAHGLGKLTDRAELLACELATNSVRHTEGSASVQLQWTHPVLRVSVCDTGPGLPFVPGARPTPADSHAAGGRGLLILDVIADRWGGCPTDNSQQYGGGKAIRFELDLVDPGPEEPASSALAT